MLGLVSPSAEVQQIVTQRGGVPEQAIPGNLPERLRTSLAGQQAYVGGG